MKKNILLISFLFSASLLFAQLKQVARFEAENKNSDENYTVIPLQRDGLALFRQTDDYDENRRKWSLTLLDINLQVKHEMSIGIHQRHNLVGYERAPGFLYLLFRKGETNRSDFELLVIDLNRGLEVSRDDIKPELDYRVTHFNIAGNSLIFGGYVSNDPAVILFDLKSKNIKVIPGFFQKDNELIDLRVNQNNTFNTVILDRSTRTDRKLIFRTFDEQGSMLLEDIVPIEDDKSLVHSMTSTLEREDLVLMGTWGDKQAKQSRGIFVLPINPFEAQHVKHIHFGSLQHMVDYLGEKRATKVRQGTEADLQNHRRPSFTAYAMPFRIQEDNAGFVMFTNFYSPLTTNNPYYNSPYYNPVYANPYAFTYPNFPGYYPGMRGYRPYPYGRNNRNAEEIRVHSLSAVAVDGSGNVLWDYSLKPEDIKRASLEQFGEMALTKDSVYLFYKKESDIRIKATSLASGETGERSERVMIHDQSDEIRNEDENDDGLMHWFGNTYFIHGYHTLRNRNKDDRSRDVFYVIKITAE